MVGNDWLTSLPLKSHGHYLFSLTQNEAMGPHVIQGESPNSYNNLKGPTGPDTTITSPIPSPKFLPWLILLRLHRPLCKHPPWWPCTSYSLSLKGYSQILTQPSVSQLSDPILLRETCLIHPIFYCDLVTPSLVLPRTLPCSFTFSYRLHQWSHSRSSFYYCLFPPAGL